jgi:hypothetical protein
MARLLHQGSCTDESWCERRARACCDERRGVDDSGFETSLLSALKAENAHVADPTAADDFPATISEAFRRVVVFLAGFTEETTPMAHEEFDPSELLDAVRAGGDIDVIRRSVEMVLRALIDAEAPR